jgi:two-component system, OmpR family, sensor histidine kinase SenX3
MGGTIAAVAVTALVVILVWMVVWRRRLTRRLSAVAVRLSEDQVSLLDHQRLESVVSSLEEAAAGAAARVDDAAVTAARLAQALDALEQGVVVCDEQGEVIYRNLLAESFAGARHAEALAEQAIDETLAAALEGEPQVRTVDLYGPPRRTLQITAVPLHEGPRAVGAIGIVEDVSDRRRLEAVRRDFVANVSHELKTPVGALALLAETLAEEDDAAVISRLAERMQAEATRVGRIIHDLLDLSRLESEESPMREPVAVHLLVAQAVEQVRGAAESRQVHLEVSMIPPEIAVNGDRRQLVSAVYNLLDNAVKYSDEDEKVEVRFRTDGRWVELSVQDHGMGIPSRDFERIFERFYRVDRARSRETGGTGLGLAIVRHVVSNHGGKVGVSSQEGQGSTFTLLLPVSPHPAGAVPPNFNGDT